MTRSCAPELTSWSLAESTQGTCCCGVKIMVDAVLFDTATLPSDADVLPGDMPGANHFGSEALAVLIQG